jgi:hypothetical protein
MDDIFESKKINKAWYFLNSSIFLWMMSSVVLALATWGYTIWSDMRSAELVREARISTLKNEIRYRLDDDILEIIFQEAGGNGSIISIETANTICNTSKSMGGQMMFAPKLGPSTDQKLQMLTDRFVYTEFKDRSVYSLLWELKEIAPDNSARIEQALESLSQLRRAAYSGDRSRPIASYFEDIRNLIRGWSSA